MINNKIWYALILILCVVGLSLIFILNVKVSDEMQNIYYGNMVQSHTKSNNLTFPLPNDESKILLKSNENLIHKYFSMDLYDFDLLLKSKYKYEDETYDCKYWTYVWLSYTLYNSKKYGWSPKIISTDNHLFVMMYNDKGYCIADLDNLNCFGSIIK